MPGQLYIKIALDYCIYRLTTHKKPNTHNANNFTTKKTPSQRNQIPDYNFISSELKQYIIVFVT